MKTLDEPSERTLRLMKAEVIRAFLWVTLVGILISLAIYGIFSSKSAKLFPLEGVAEKKALKN